MPHNSLYHPTQLNILLFELQTQFSKSAPTCFRLGRCRLGHWLPVGDCCCFAMVVVECWICVQRCPFELFLLCCVVWRSLTGFVKSIALLNELSIYKKNMIRLMDANMDRVLIHDEDEMISPLE